MSLANLIAFGRVTLVDDSKDLQELQITEKAYGKGIVDRILDKVVRLVDFGFASAPPIDAEAMILRRNGDRGHSVVIAASHRPSRPKNLKPGDTVVYDVRGAKVQLTEDGLLIDCAGLAAQISNATSVTITASDEITLDAPTVSISGDLEVQGAITGHDTVTAHQGGSSVEMGALRDAYSAHKHGGVDTGTGVSGISDHTV